MEVFKYGTTVTTAVGKINGMITCISIRQKEVIYEITYYDNGTFHTTPMRDYEFTTDNPETTKIGFK